MEAVYFFDFWRVMRLSILILCSLLFIGCSEAPTPCALGTAEQCQVLELLQQHVHATVRMNHIDDTTMTPSKVFLSEMDMRDEWQLEFASTEVLLKVYDLHRIDTLHDDLVIDFNPHQSTELRFFKGKYVPWLRQQMADRAKKMEGYRQ